ncbi:hypothetical protein H0N96_03460 [Candidatus Micrarchaeota archaeon]|nr:hypothetical protein [Candidatus Micrarchaeota archaeon]
MKRFDTILIAFTLFLTFLAPGVFASHLIVTDPVSQTADATAIVDLGVVGPGQKLEVVATRASGEKAKNIAYEKEAAWDRIFVIPEELPSGWSSEDSKWYEEQMHAFVTVAKDAEDGIYFFKIRAFDEYEGVSALEVSFKVTVSRDLLEAQLVEKTVSVGVEQPALFYLRLKNKSSASDAFEIKVSGPPSIGTGVTRKVYLRHNSEDVIPIELFEGERGEYATLFEVKSLSSDAINAKDSATVLVFTSILHDMQAVSHGVLLFPTAEQLIYALLGLIAKLLS